MARILVIDDEREIRWLLHGVLTRKGHEVFLAEGGQQGVDLFCGFHPTVTILDIRMPGMDGLQVLREIQTVKPGASVIVMTGWYSEETRERVSALGAIDCLKKGFSLQDLGEALKRTLAQKSTMPALSH